MDEMQTGLEATGREIPQIVLGMMPYCAPAWRDGVLDPEAPGQPRPVLGRR